VRGDGTAAWEAAFEAPGATIEALVVDARADVIMVGASELPTASGPVGGPGCLVVKRSGVDGRAIWARQLAGTGDQACRAAATDAAGDVYVAGMFAGTLATPSGPLVSAGSHDALVMRLAGGDGTPRWIRRLGGGNNDLARAIAVDRAGDVIVGGQFAGDGPVEAGSVDFGTGALGSAGDFDGFVVKLSPAGTARWARGFGDVGFDVVKSVAVDRDGELFVSGAWMRPQDFHAAVPLLTGVMDGLVARYSPRGELVWRRLLTGGGGSQVHRIVVDHLGQPWIVGHFKGAIQLGGRALAAPPGSQRSTAYAARLTRDGAAAWAELIGAPSAGYAYQLDVVAGGAIVVGGDARGPARLCGQLREAADDDDHYLVRFAPAALPR
jgi:hypothetical protein